MAERLKELGHERITYLTFNRTAAADGKARLPGVDCRTLHSQAMKSLGLPTNISLHGEDKVERFISKTFDREIDHMLRRVNKKKKSKLYRAERTRLAFFIRRTLDFFTMSTDSIDSYFRIKNRSYYPAVKHHQGADHLDTDVGDFYTSAARRLYELLLPDKDGKAKAGFTTYDVIMKQAELAQAPIPGSALLVDESQDCSASQILWTQQARRGKLLVFVGDAVQTIYGFRGAKSANLLGLRGCIDATLTTSFRFGQNLASVANALLFIKENVTTKDWRPYRVTGGARGAGEVFFRGPSLETDLPFTVIAFTNATLLNMAIDLITRAGEAGRAPPKFAINGDGENSGRNRWLATLKVFKDVHALYSGTSDKIHSREFESRSLSWDDFSEEVFERSLGKFMTAVSLVIQYKEGTGEILEQFRHHVIEADLDKSEADVLLTTVHAAKGQEWDSVVVCDDLLKLAKFGLGKDKRSSGFRSARQASSDKYCFQIPDWSDALNVWYVALTRAKRRLFLPARLIEVFKIYAHALAAADPSHADHKEKISSGIRDDIVTPWMTEAMGHYPESSLLAFVRNPASLEEDDEDEDDEDEDDEDENDSDAVEIVEDVKVVEVVKIESDGENDGAYTSAGTRRRTWAKISGLTTSSSQDTEILGDSPPPAKRRRARFRGA